MTAPPAAEFPVVSFQFKVLVVSWEFSARLRATQFLPISAQVRSQKLRSVSLKNAFFLRNSRGSEVASYVGHDNKPIVQISGTHSHRAAARENVSVRQRDPRSLPPSIRERPQSRHLAPADSRRAIGFGQSRRGRRSVERRRLRVPHESGPPRNQGIEAVASLHQALPPAESCATRKAARRSATALFDLRDDRAERRAPAGRRTCGETSSTATTENRQPLTTRDN